MPKLTDRERLAKIESDQRALAQQAETVRRGLRAHYGRLAMELAIERLSEREFREVLAQAIRVGGANAVAALKALAVEPDGSAEKRLPPKTGDVARTKSGTGDAQAAALS